LSHILATKLMSLLMFSIMLPCDFTRHAGENK